MNALSIRQPWAELIVTGKKDVENRTWRTHYRGPIVIHASQTVDPYGSDRFPVETNQALCRSAIGAIVGFAFLYACAWEHHSEWHEDDCWGWYLANPIIVQPRFYSGSRGLFNIEIDKLGYDICARCRKMPSLPASHLCGCCKWHLDYFGESAPTQLPIETQQYSAFLREERKRSFEEERMQ